MVEKWRKAFAEGGETGTVLTDLSKAFDYIDHNLLIAKLNACGFEKRLLEFIHSHLTKRKQRIKLDSVFSSWEMLFSVLFPCCTRVSPRTVFTQYLYL